MYGLLMPYFERTLILCKMKNLPNQAQHLCYVPELLSFQCAAEKIKDKNISESLSLQLKQIKQYQKQFGLGIFPFKLSSAKEFIENLYHEMLTNGLPLPVNPNQSDLKYQIKKMTDFEKNLFIYELKIKINDKNLTFFAKHLPWLGTIATYTLTLGFTVSALATVFGWGWSLFLLAFFGICKGLATYADIAGGPERRLRILGFALDRWRSGHYARHGKFSHTRTLLNFLVISILTCSSFSTWYGGWYMIRCMAGMSYFPTTMVATLAGLFAWASTGSSFGRIYSDLYQLLYRFFSRFICFDNVKDIEKVDLNLLTQKLRFHDKSMEQDVIDVDSKACLHQYAAFTTTQDDNETRSLNRDVQIKSVANYKQFGI